MSAPELEDLERRVGQAGQGDLVQDAFLRVLAADLLEKGEPLPPPLRNYIATSLRGNHAEAIATEFRELCLSMLRVLVSYLQPNTPREEVADSAVKALERIRQFTEEFSLGRRRRLPESLRELECVIVWVLFMVKQWEITSVNVADARKLRSWQEAVEAVSEQLGLRSGYAPRSIANVLKYFMMKGRSLKGRSTGAPIRGRHPRGRSQPSGECIAP